MNKNLFRLTGGSLLALILSATSLAQSIVGTPGGSVVGKSLDINSFSKLIGPDSGPAHFERNHDEIPLATGVSNTLLPGIGVSSTKAWATGKYFPTNGYTGSEPPDPDVAVSASHVVVVVNSTIGFYTKTGQQLLLQQSRAFFNSVSTVGFQFDPRVAYDAVNKRFIMLFLALDSANSKSFILLAVSNGENPMNGWKLYNLDVTQTEGSDSFWLDYPGLGFDKKTVAFSGNMFGFANGYNGVQFIGLDKAALYAGTATMTKFKAGGGTAQLAKQNGTLTDAVYAIQTISRSAIRVSAITNAGSMALTQKDIPVPTWNPAAGEIKGPDGKGHDTINDGRIFNATSRGDRMVGGHVVASGAAGTTPAARWYEVKLNNWPVTAGANPVLFQSGNVVPPAGHGYTFPGLCLDRSGNIGMTFSKIGTTTGGDVMVAGRRATDPLGFMGAPTVLEAAKSNTDSNFSDRWGDYFDLELDPVDNSTFWAIGMGPNAQGKWQTYVKTFFVALPDSQLDRTVADPIVVVNGRRASGDRTSMFSDDNLNYVLASDPVRGLGQVCTLRAVFSLPYTQYSSVRLAYTLNGPANASALVLLLNVSTGQYEQVASTGLTGIKQSKSIDLTDAQMLKYVSPTGVVTAVVRGIMPVRGGTMPSAIQLSIDKLNVLSSPKN